MLVPLFPPSYGGAGLQAERLAQALGARGVRVTVLTTRALDSDAGARARTSFGAVRRFRSPAALRAIDAVLGASASAWLATHSFDLLHVHTVGYFAVAPIWTARARGRPYLLKTSLLGGDDLAHVRRGRLGALLLSAYRRAAAVVALSEPIERELRGDPALRGRIARIPNGVDLERFAPAPEGERERLRAARGIDTETLVLITAGQLGARKGVIPLVEVVGRLRGPRLLVLAGPEDRAGEPALRRALAGLPPGLGVRRPGRLAPDDLADWLRAADVFVLNSRAEGLPNALLEAAASGLACVATDIPGSREVLAGEAGLLVPADDRDALARALGELHRDPELRVRLGRRARERAVREFSLERVAEAYLALYQQVCAAGPPR